MILRIVKILVISLLILYIDVLSAQYKISNGVNIPTRDTIRVFMVFAEVDYVTGSCPDNLPDNLNGDWPKDNNGKTLVPKNADNFLDHELKEGQPPKAYITDYYYQASFGQYVLLGDYYPEVISIPCNRIRVGDSGIRIVTEFLDQRKPEDTTLYSKHGYALSEFDAWTPTRQGLPKIKESDGKIDLMYIIWRNNRFLTTANTKPFAGYGIHTVHSPSFKDMKGVNTLSSFNAAEGESNSSFYVTIIEHLHGLFGGNNWHSTGGRGIHTFLGMPITYGLTAQLNAAMNAPGGWDRWMMEWKNPQKLYLISALDEGGNEVNTENLSIKQGVKEQIFILRDFMRTSDALRIKLPHIDWKQDGDVKNQYLWIENRRMDTKYDKWYVEKCADNNNGEFPYGTPGIYAYIQVGKDQREGGDDLYSAAIEKRNGLASCFFPVSAEGNFDLHYRYDMMQRGRWIPCNWNNKNLPFEKEQSVPNPFTGNSDLYKIHDVNKDGRLWSGDKQVHLGLSEVIGDSVVHNYNCSGDWEDAFSFATGKTKLSLSTNPAPVPVYTYTTDYEHKRFYLDGGDPYGFENQTIWLNGLSIEILEEDLGSGEVKIKVKWDDYNLEENVRWCGNIALSANDFDTSQPSLVVHEDVTLHLDRGKSPTKHQTNQKDESGNWLFSDTTVFKVLRNSYLRQKPNSIIIVDNGSKLMFEKGSRIELDKGATIILRNGGILNIEEGTEIVIENRARIIDENTGRNYKCVKKWLRHQQKESGKQ